ncbi:MAG: hypothetical protein ACLPIX_21800, partial [Rhodomicrobium sp.]
MSNRFEAFAHLANQTLRTGYYVALYRMTNRRAASTGEVSARISTGRPVPGLWTLLQDVLRLQAQDARNVRNGIYPIPVEEGASPGDHIGAVRRMFADLPQSAGRRAERRTDEAAS